MSLMILMLQQRIGIIWGRWHQLFSSIGFLEALNLKKRFFSEKFRVISSYKVKKSKKPDKKPRFTSFLDVKYVNYIYEFL